MLSAEASVSFSALSVISGLHHSKFILQEILTYYTDFVKGGFWKFGVIYNFEVLQKIFTNN